MKDCFKSVQNKYCGVSAWIYALAMATFLVVIINYEGLKFAISVVGIVGTAGVAIYTSYQAKMREINARHFTEKREAYMGIMNILFDIITASKKGKTPSPDKLQTKMMEFKKNLIVWGSATVIRAWNDYEMLVYQQPGDKKIVEGIESVLRAIRDDLGHDDSALKFGSLWGLLLIPEDKGIIMNNPKGGKK